MKRKKTDRIMRLLARVEAGEWLRGHDDRALRKWYARETGKNWRRNGNQKPGKGAARRAALAAQGRLRAPLELAR